MSDHFCKCGHRRSDHEERANYWLACEFDECDCGTYQRARGETATALNEGREIKEGK